MSQTHEKKNKQFVGRHWAHRKKGNLLLAGKQLANVIRFIELKSRWSTKNSVNRVKQHWRNEFRLEKPIKNQWKCKICSAGLLQHNAGFCVDIYDLRYLTSVSIRSQLFLRNIFVLFRFDFSCCPSFIVNATSIHDFYNINCKHFLRSLQNASGITHNMGH